MVTKAEGNPTKDKHGEHEGMCVSYAVWSHLYSSLASLIGKPVKNNFI